MDSFLCKKNVVLTIDLIVGDNFVTPDEGSIVTYSLLGNDFSPMEDYTDIEVETQSYGTSISVVIPKEANEISSVYEIRTVILDVFVKGQQLTFKKQYRLSSIPAHIVSKDDVRKVFGLNDSDLPDDSIDIDSSYFSLLLDYPEIETWFKSGGSRSVKANRILALKTALTFSNGLSLLASASESDGQSKMSRFEKGMNFDKQVAISKGELDELLDEVTNEGNSNRSISYFNVVSTENIFTGQS